MYGAEHLICRMEDRFECMHDDAVCDWEAERCTDSN